MGEAKRKRFLREREWVKLFDNDSPTSVAIYRPERGLTTIDHNRVVQGYGEIIGNRSSVRPTLCFDEKCGTKILHFPDVYILVRTSTERPMFMATCSECGKKTDDEIRDIVRADLKNHGLGNEVDPTLKSVQIPIQIYQQYEPLPGIFLGVTSEEDCAPADVLAHYLSERKLPRFLTFRLGMHNCHRIVEQLYLDFRDLGVVDMFGYRRGSSAVLSCDSDPEGLHTWIEADGWAIETSQQGAGNPVIFDRIETFYERFKLTKIRDLRAEYDQAASSS